MTEYVYKVVIDDEEVYFVDDADSIIDMFGTVAEVIRFRLVDPEDITDEVNGGYLRE